MPGLVSALPSFYSVQVSQPGVVDGPTLRWAFPQLLVHSTTGMSEAHPPAD